MSVLHPDRRVGLYPTRIPSQFAETPAAPACAIGTGLSEELYLAAAASPCIPQGGHYNLDEFGYL